MSWGENVYDSPGKYGLTIIGSLNDPESCYSFDDLHVWQHADGRLFYATDFGCSCPSPFEDYTKLDDLTPVTLDTWLDFSAVVLAHAVPYGDRPDPQVADKTQLLAKVSGLLRTAERSTAARLAKVTAGVAPSLPGVPVVHITIDADTLHVTSETDEVIVDTATAAIHFHGTDADLALFAARLNRACGAA